MPWVKVSDEQPPNSGFYVTRMVVGSISTEVVEGNRVMFKNLHGIDRWISGDWQTVIEWHKETDNDEEKEKTRKIN